MELFNTITDKLLTPNEYYLLYCLHYGHAAKFINIHQELRGLISKGWIKKVGDKFELQPDAIEFVESLQAHDKIRKRKSLESVMGSDFKENIRRYIEYFPKIKLPSGKPARCSEGNIESAFKWFFEKHTFSWEIIFKATVMYINDYESRDYNYMQTSQYFIRKQATDKTWGSELANWCLMIEQGLEKADDHFSEKVV